MKISKNPLVVLAVALAAALVLIGTVSAAGPGPDRRVAGRRALNRPVMAAAVTPVPTAAHSVLPDYIGSPAKAHPLANNGVPQNPLLAPNPFNAAHRDTWNSDTANVAGPLGRNPQVLSSVLADAQPHPSDLHSLFNCTTQLFDSHGRVITVCFTPAQATVVMADPDTLKVLASFPLPPRTTASPYSGAGCQKALVSMGAIYSYLDAHDRFTVVAGGTQIWTLVEGGSEENPVFEVPDSNKIDLSQLIHPNVDGPIAGVMLDWQGRIWFTTAGAENGNQSRIYVLNPATAVYPYTDVKYLEFGVGEIIRNTFAIAKSEAGRTAAYLVTSKEMYRIDAGPDDRPYVVWHEPYDNSYDEQIGHGIPRPGQYELGSGTSPTILGEGRYVAITDNAIHMQVAVFRTDERLGPKQERIVCEVPVFVPAGTPANQPTGALSNSLAGSRLSLIATNNANYCFDWETATMLSPSVPGFARVDIDPNGKGCTKVWENSDVATTTCPRLSTKTGLIYSVARAIDKSRVVYPNLGGLDVYYWTALDFRTGDVVWQKMAGTGMLYDSFYPAGGDIGPNGVLYYGGYGGLMTIRDTR